MDFYQIFIRKFPINYCQLFYVNSLITSIYKRIVKLFSPIENLFYFHLFFFCLVIVTRLTIFFYNKNNNSNNSYKDKY